MCKFKNYPRTFHDNWEYPTQSFGCIVSSILPSTSLTPRRNWIYFRPLFATSLRLLFHTLLGFIVIIIILLYYPRFSTSTYLPTSLSIQFLPWLGRTTRLFPFFLIYLFISSHFLDRIRYKSNKDTSIISIFSCSKFYRFNSSSWSGSKRKLAALFLFSLMTDDRSKGRTKR